MAAPANQRLPAGDRNETEAAKKSRVTTEMMDGKCTRGGKNWQDQGKCIVLMAWQANKERVRAVGGISGVMIEAACAQ